MGTAYSPRPAAPGAFRRRSFSFAIEFYQSLRRSHRLIFWVFSRVFPNPLTVSPRALKQAGLRGGLLRGQRVDGAAGTGRLIGRHPITGAPVVAWTGAAFEAMCESFDDEHAARIVAWQESAARLSLSTEACTRRALRVDQRIRWLVGLIVLAGMLGGAGTGMVIGGALPAGIAGGLGGLLGGVLVGLPVLLLAGVVGLLLLRLVSVIGAVAVAVMASRRARSAAVTDAAGRTSAAQIVAAMQGGAAPERARTVVRPSTSGRQTP